MKHATITLTHGAAAILEDLLVSPCARLTGVQADTLRDILQQFRDKEANHE